MLSEQSSEKVEKGGAPKRISKNNVLLSLLAGYGLAMFIPAIHTQRKDIFIVAALEVIPWVLLALREVGSRSGRNNAFNIFFGLLSLVVCALLNSTADASTRAFVFPIILAGQISLVFVVLGFDGVGRLLRK
ncbi:hypothetical protein HPT27_16115 [Permianibacter sp. IMCC34836]|uniref:hypothetical protein n=1 Tax=Permianibacter fluminis TaxID=2738515 RepID=UPI00155278AA|nr:hypothetical protein [Permianibacter fluminis]NQD38549.1 hypothetical protein [Permianibacter fluminis]